MRSDLEIRQSIVTAASRERVWQAITEPEQISTWFGDPIEFSQLMVGEPMIFMKQYPGSIAIVEPPERFAFYWLADVNHTDMNLVTFLLETVAEGTRITVTEQGFEALPDELGRQRYDSNKQGWRIQLENIATYLQSQTNA